jgi:hypothetical protein
MLPQRTAQFDGVIFRVFFIVSRVIYFFILFLYKKTNRTDFSVLHLVILALTSFVLSSLPSCCITEKAVLFVKYEGLRVKQGRISLSENCFYSVDFSSLFILFCLFLKRPSRSIMYDANDVQMFRTNVFLFYLIIVLAICSHHIG